MGSICGNLERREGGGLDVPAVALSVYGGVKPDRMDVGTEPAAPDEFVAGGEDVNC